MKLRLPLAAALLARHSGIAVAQQPAAPAPARPRGPAEDARLTHFLDAAFDEQIATNPQQLTQLGSRQLYDRLNDYTDAYRSGQLALEERQLAELRRRFDPARLSAAGRLSFRLFEKEVTDDRAAFRWRWHALPGDQQWQPDGQHPRLPDQQSPGRERRRRRGLCRAAARGRAGDGRDRRQYAPPDRARHRPARLQLRAGARGRPPDPRRRAVRRRAGQRALRRFQGQGRPARNPAGREGPADRRRARGADRPVPPRL